MDTKSKLALAGLIAAGVIVWWIGKNLEPGASRWLSQALLVGLGAAFVGWIGWLAVTANGKRG